MVSKGAIKLDVIHHMVKTVNRPRNVEEFKKHHDVELFFRRLFSYETFQKRRCHGHHLKLAKLCLQEAENYIS